MEGNRDMNGFRFSQTSLGRLNGVKAELCAVVGAALVHTRMDFGVSEGMRSWQRQAELYADGRSKADGTPVADGGTGQSKHQYGAAVDVLAYARGKHTLDGDAYFPVAAAFAVAAQQVGVPLRWGGAWTVADLRQVVADHMPGDMDALTAGMEAAQRDYVRERRGQNRTPFIDAYHFELN